MSTHRFLTVALWIVSSTACRPFHQEPVVLVGTQDAISFSTDRATFGSRWRADLASPTTRAGSVQTNGSAWMDPGPSFTTTNITLNLVNASPGGLHPWAVHLGQCGVGMDAGVFGLSEAYRPLMVESDGHATGIATVLLPTPMIGTYFVVVHASVVNSETIVACGNLAPPTR
jgi:hypothetical protein